MTSEFVQVEIWSIDQHEIDYRRRCYEESCYNVIVCFISACAGLGGWVGCSRWMCLLGVSRAVWKLVWKFFGGKRYCRRPELPALLIAWGRGRKSPKCIALSLIVWILSKVHCLMESKQTWKNTTHRFAKTTQPLLVTFPPILLPIQHGLVEIDPNFCTSPSGERTLPPFVSRFSLRCFGIFS